MSATGIGLALLGGAGLAALTWSLLVGAVVIVLAGFLSRTDTVN
jgi:hypothetical protein